MHFEAPRENVSAVQWFRSVVLFAVGVFCQRSIVSTAIESQWAWVWVQSIWDFQVWLTGREGCGGIPSKTIENVSFGALGMNKSRAQCSYVGFLKVSLLGGEFLCDTKVCLSSVPLAFPSFSYFWLRVVSQYPPYPVALILCGQKNRAYQQGSGENTIPNRRFCSGF